MGMTGAFARSDEAEEADHALIQTGLARLGYTARRVETAGRRAEGTWERLVRSLDRGMPIPCFLPEGADVLVGYDASRRAFLARAVTEQGKVGVVVLGRADLRA